MSFFDKVYGWLLMTALFLFSVVFTYAIGGPFFVCVTLLAWGCAIDNLSKRKGSEQQSQ